MADLADVQAEHKAWLAKRYPSQAPIEPAVGLLEETGELAHCLLKCQQMRGWKHPEQRYEGADWSKKFIDAVGDCFIFACSLCNANDWSFEELHDSAAKSNAADKQLFTTAYEMVASLAEKAANCIRRPANMLTLHVYMRQLLAICTTWNIDAIKAIKLTWQEVKER